MGVSKKKRTRNFKQKLKWHLFIHSKDSPGRFARIVGPMRYPWPWWVKLESQEAEP